MAYKLLREAFLIEGTILNDSDNTFINLDKAITNVMVENDFLNKVMPLFVVDLRVTEDVRDRIRDNNIRLALKIFSYDNDNESQLNIEDDTSPTITDIIFNDVIRVYDKKIETTASYKEEDEEDDKSNNIPYFHYRLVGIPETSIKKNSETINTIYSGATLNDILVNVASTINENADVFIDPTGTDIVLNSVLIPPLTFTQAIDFLDSNYQIYSGGICSVYLDMTGKTYIYNPLYPRSEENKLEYKVIGTESNVNSNELNRAKIDDDTGSILVTNNNLPGYSNAQEIIGNSVGSNTIFYSYGDGFELVTRSIESEKLYPKTKFIWNDKQNYTFEKSMKDTLLSSSTVLTFTLSGVSPSRFSPLTNIKITGKYDFANSDYFLGKLSYAFSSTDYTHFNSILYFEGIKK